MQTKEGATEGSHSDAGVPSRQEMFDRAVRGLRSQGWRVAVEGGVCRYLTPDGRRCAWGWVDPKGTAGPACEGTVQDLQHGGYGLAARLSYGLLRFADLLQKAHDATTDEHLELRMRDFAEEHGLVWPEGVES